MPEIENTATGLTLEDLGALEIRTIDLKHQVAMEPPESFAPAPTIRLEFQGPSGGIRFFSDESEALRVARAIKLLPELKAALEDLLHHCTTPDGVDPEAFDKAIADARAILAKLNPQT